MVGAATDVFGPLASDDVLGRRFEDTAAVLVAHGQAEIGGPAAVLEQLLDFVDRGAFFQQFPEEHQHGHAFEVALGRVVLAGEDLVDGQRQPGVVHAGDGAKNDRKGHGGANMFLGRLEYGDQREFRKVLVRRPVEDPPEQRRLGLAALGFDDHRRTAADLLQVGHGVGEDEQVALDAGGLGRRLELCLVVLGENGHQEAAGAEHEGIDALKAALFHIAVDVVDERLLGRLDGQRAELFADLFGRAFDDQDGDAVDVFQFPLAVLGLGIALLGTLRPEGRQRTPEAGREERWRWIGAALSYLCLIRGKILFNASSLPICRRYLGRDEQFLQSMRLIVRDRPISTPRGNLQIVVRSRKEQFHLCSSPEK